MPIVFQKNKGLLLVSLGAAAIAVACGYYYAFCNNVLSISLEAPNCDLGQSPCTAITPNGEKITLEITPTHMPVLTSVQLKVRTEALKPYKVTVDFKGAQMNMGEFRYHLTPQKDGSFNTQTILPTCVHQEMVWHAVLSVDTTNRHYSVPFVFVNQRKNVS